MRQGRTALVFVLSLMTMLTTPKIFAEDKPPYLDASQPIETRVEDLLSRMTLEEKVSILHGNSKFTTNGIPHLNIPVRWMSDGPMGVREDVGPDTWKPAGHTDDFSTAFPALIGLAATFNPDLAHSVGQTIGQEARQRNKHIMLGPGVNIQRTPLNGRNFEYMGEDPWLTSRMAVQYIEGAQAEQIASCVKHFACNNQETDRHSIDVQMDDRTLHEIYLPAFKAAVQEAKVWCVMGAYNRFRGEQCCQNDFLLNKILKQDWGFKGLVMSDWAGTYDTTKAVLGGLDLEMGTVKPYNEFYLADPYLAGLKKGTFKTDLLDDKVRRNLRVMFATKVFDGKSPGSINTPAHQEAALKVAEESLVLLKNQGDLLPLDTSKTKSVAVIGDNAVRKLCHEGGSMELKAFYEITPLQGIVNRAGQHINVTFSQGYSPTTRPAPDADLIDRAVAAAKSADVAIIFGGLDRSKFHDAEDSDRKDIRLPWKQDELIQKVTAANPKTVVVLMDGGAMEMDPWLDQVPALMQAWYPGMEGGNAIAHVLFGDVNPSGKLPCTFPKKLSDSPAHALDAYPGKDGKEEYKEGLLVGYRWFDTKNVEPLFPFGYGLSYTKFEYSNLKVSETSAEFDVTNTGPRDGAEVAQLYVQEEKPALERPTKELKGFSKVFLKAGEKKTVTIPLTHSSFAYYNPDKQAWVADAGDFTILVGGSSRDIKLKDTVTLKETTVEKD